MTLRLLAITGRPGVGKTTLVLEISQRARSLGCRVGGIVTPEVRAPSGYRWGFKVRDLITGQEHVLASVDAGGPRIGKYRLDPKADDFITSTIRRALTESDLLIIDEVGPMELSLTGFRNLITAVLSSPPLPIALTFHYRLRTSNPGIYELVTRGRVVELTEFNRSSVWASIEGLTRWLVDEACGDKGGKGATLHT
ncbi:MAG: nucleoside-triphosphatase [Acidilobus sp.]